MIRIVIILIVGKGIRVVVIIVREGINIVVIILVGNIGVIHGYRDTETHRLGLSGRTWRS